MAKRYAPIFSFVAIATLALVAKQVLEPRVESRRASPSLPVLESAYLGHSLKRYSLGLDNVTADLLWLQLLQKASIEPVAAGKVSWEYAQLEALTTLDPKFERAYSFGAAFLSVYRQDKLGAEQMLEKWVKRRPTYWRAHYTLGYHLYFEKGDYAAAAPHLLTASALPGAPTWLSSLGVRLLSEAGALTQALRISIELFETLLDPEAKYRLTQRIRSLRFGLEKNAWENALSRYREAKGKEPPNLEAVRPFVRDEVRELSSLVEREDLPEELVAILAEHFAFRYDAGSHSIRALNPVDEAALGQVGIYRPRQ